MRRAAVVVQRYGEEVNGGSEVLARQIAERMTRHWQVDVLTTCGLDYRTWADHYPPGERELNGVKVIRFRVDHPRCQELFDRLSAPVLSGGQAMALQERWMKEQGPYSSGLLWYVHRHQRVYDVFVFFTYLYATTYFLLPAVADRSILVPTAHDEGPLRVELYDRIFAAPRALFFCTEEEERLVRDRFPMAAPGEVVAMGVDIGEAERADGRRFLARYRDRVRGDILLYVGRVDEIKGCGALCEQFIRLREDDPASALTLVLIGRKGMQVPAHRDIVALGFVSEEEKFDAMAAASALVMPSRFESLSIAILESWAVGTPVIVNGESDVLEGQCRRSGGGHVYRDYEGFKHAIRTVVGDERERRRLGQNGQAFVWREYRWERVEEAYRRWGEKIGPRPDGSQLGSGGAVGDT